MFLNRVLFFCILGMVLFLTLTPDNALQVHVINDKIEHFVAFFVLAVFGFNGWPQRRPLQLAIALLAVGAAIEVLQATPLIHRDAEFLDWLADAIGTGAALTSWQILTHYLGGVPPS